MKEDVCASLPGGRNFSFLKQGMPVVANKAPLKKNSCLWNFSLLSMTRIAISTPVQGVTG